MYHLITGLYAYHNQKPRYNVLLLGISGSGKTAWLDKVRAKVTRTSSRSMNRFHPTVGQNVLDLNLARATLHFWDLGGDESLRRLWSRYFEEADALVWAFDARDWITSLASEDGKSKESNEAGVSSERRQESWDALSKLLYDSSLTSLPLLLLFTHLDELEGALAAQFVHRVKPIVQDKLAELARAEERDLEEEMSHMEQSIADKEHRKRVWDDWDIVAGSARDGTGTDDFVTWLQSRANASHGR